MEKKTVISLFDYSGNWSKPYRDNGYEVIQVDIKKGIDILTWDYKYIDKEKVLGILAAVPCTDFAVSGARWFKDKDIDGRTKKSIELVEKTMEIINYFNPKFWVIENPVSRIHTVCPQIGTPKFSFHPYYFNNYIDNPDDDSYTKKTILYGKFNHPIKKQVAREIDTTKIHMPTREDGTKIGWNTEECKTARQNTPKGFAIAFYNSNNIDNKFKTQMRMDI
jgi:hypothetical protein